MKTSTKIDFEMATPAQRLKYVRALLRLSRSDIKDKYALSTATLKAWENGSSRLTVKGLKQCLDIYRHEGIVLSEDWIATGSGLPPKLSIDIGRYLVSDYQYPVSNSYSSGGPIQERIPPAYLGDETACILREATFFKDSYPDAVVLMVSSDDMEPAYQMGDYVGGRYRYEHNITSVLRRDCIVKLEDGREIVRRLYKSNLKDYYNLACINPLPSSEDPIIFNVPIIAAAPIIWHRISNG